MIKVLFAALIGAAVSVQAVAANSDDYTPEYRAYTSYSFGAPQTRSLGLHYGLRMDHDSREQLLASAHAPAIVQLDFSGRSGFEGVSIYGMPLTSRVLQLNETEEKSKTEKVLWFSGWFLLGGVVYGIHEWTKSSPSATVPGGGGGGGGGGGDCCK